MSDHDKVMFAISVAPGSKQEHPIENVTFLRSYAEHGVWLRVLPAASQLHIVGDKDASEFTKIAHTAAFFAQAAMLYEDTVSMLAALATVASQKRLRIADVLHRISLRRNSAPAGGAPSVRSIVTQIANGGNRVSVDPAGFIDSIKALSGDELLAILGLSWQQDPPKHMPRDDGWQKLPILVQEVVRLLSDRNGGLVTAYYNKVKHGPQALVDSVQRVAIDARGHSESVRSSLPPRPSLENSRTGCANARGQGRT